MEIPKTPFAIASESEFTALALEIFRYQYEMNLVYREYVDLLKVSVGSVGKLTEIPFLPIELFKTRKVVCGERIPQGIFKSSGTTGMVRSVHHVIDLNIYRNALQLGFERFYGSPDNYQFLALVPTPEQSPDSSLVFMVQRFMDLSQSAESGYFLSSFSGLHARLRQAQTTGRKVFLIGLTYALLDFAEAYPGEYGSPVIVETGGMKGKRKEMTREELHSTLCPAFRVSKIHSEYGMTELLSQAYSPGDGLFTAPPWMRIMIRDTNDPFTYIGAEKTGGINIIDLANIHSCSFIATQDLGRIHYDGRFEVLGRFDASDTRGCSLMLA
jgi:hypothetical protein